MIKIYSDYDRAKIKLFLAMGGRYLKKERCWLFPDYMARDFKSICNIKIEQTDTNKDTRPCKYIQSLLKTTPYSHQKIATEASLERMGFAFFAETGTGKTKMVLDNIIMRYHAGRIRKAFVVCPLSSIGVWESEIKIHTNFDSVSLIGTKDERIENFKLFFNHSGMIIAIINYEGIAVLEDILLKYFQPDWFLICDESTKIKNPKKTKSRRTFLSMKLAEKTEYRAILTGTPITNTIMDIFSQMFVVDVGNSFGYNWYQFRNYWFVPDYMKFNWSPKPELYEYIENILPVNSVRMLKDDCLDLPDKIYEKRFVYLSEKERKSYDEMLNDFITKLDSSTEISALAIVGQIQKLQQIANGFIYDENGVSHRIGDSKLKTLLELLEENSKSKIIVWIHYKSDAVDVVKAISKIGLNVFSMTSENVTDVCNEFQTKNSPMIIVSNPQSCGYSITLTKADLVIYYSNSYNAEYRYQSEDRVHRIGLNHKIVYIDLIAKDTIDEKISEALLVKSDLMKEILDIKNFLSRK